MPKPEKNAMALVDACRSPIRRQIMILAEEAAASDETISVKRAADKLGKGVGSVAYHFKALAKAGALREVKGEQKRGAWQKNYVPSEAFQATMTDTVALDQIAELIDGKTIVDSTAEKVVGIVRATGRPVEA